MGVGAEANMPPPELWDGRYYLSAGSAPGPNAATNWGHAACYRVSGGGAGDEGISASDWQDIIDGAKVSEFAMAQAVNATAAAPWWARMKSAATATGQWASARAGIRARLIAYDGASLSSQWVTG